MIRNSITKKLLPVAGALFLIFQGCGYMGTRIEMAPNGIPGKLKRVAVAPVFIDNSGMQYLEPKATELLVDALRESGQFQIVEPDSVRRFLASRDWDVLNPQILLSQLPAMNVDGLVICELDLGYYNLEYYSVAWLKLYVPTDDNPVTTIVFDTHLGKAYFLPPSPYKVALDSIEGSVRGLRRALNR
ncbi:MAG: hypothetical protein GXO92_03310 [FCB group bacterium]|nr:hypothetical protein [FCB group bacterium]